MPLLIDYYWLLLLDYEYHQIGFLVDYYYHYGSIII